MSEIEDNKIFCSRFGRRLVMCVGDAAESEREALQTPRLGGRTQNTLGANRP